MKKLLMIAASVCFIATAALAQSGSKMKAPAGSKTTAKAQYECPKCMAMSDKAGKCAHCNVNMVKVGDYYCPGCYATSSKPGHCAKCNMDMKQMTAAK